MGQNGADVERRKMIQIWTYFLLNMPKKGISAVISYGACGILNIMKEYGLEVGKYCSDFCVSCDTKRIKEMGRKSSDHSNKSRKRGRAE